METKFHAHLKSIYRVPHHHKGRHSFLRLDGNELVPHLDLEIAEQIISKITPHHFSAYPELEECYDILSNYLNLPRQNLLITNGSEAAIRQVFQIYCGQNKNDQVLNITPNYGMYAVYTELFNATKIEVSYDASFQISIEDIISKINNKTKLITIANPNGALGCLFKDADLLKIAEVAGRYGAALIIDEAYYEFRGDSVWPKIATEHENIIVIRTLSKAGGLAGIRYGYIVTNTNLANILWKAKPIYELNSIAALAGNYLLSQPELIKRWVNEIIQNKELLCQKLRYLGLDYYKGYANFVLVNVKEKAELIISKMEKNKIKLRSHGNHPLLSSYLRFTVGKENSMDHVLSTLDEIYKQVSV